MNHKNITYCTLHMFAGSKSATCFWHLCFACCQCFFTFNVQFLWELCVILRVTARIAYWKLMNSRTCLFDSIYDIAQTNFLFNFEWCKQIFDCQKNAYSSCMLNEVGDSSQLLTGFCNASTINCALKYCHALWQLCIYAMHFFLSLPGWLLLFVYEINKDFVTSQVSRLD